MPSEVLLICVFGLIAWLIRRDMSWRRAGSSAIWIPAIWLTILASRSPSAWFSSGEGDINTEGNPINTIVFALLVVGAVVVLQRRRFNWGRFFGSNKAVLAIYVYFALSMVWSEYPFVSGKRLVKDFGNILVALVLLTDKNPYQAVRMVFVRVAYVLFPLSIVLGKYFPIYGRNYSKAGEPLFTGVTTQKNSLGETVLVLGLVMLWDFLEIRRSKEKKVPKGYGYIVLAMFVLGIWLLKLCDSRTSLLCLMIGSAFLFASAKLVEMKRGKQVLITCLLVVGCLKAVDKTFGLSDALIKAAGRNPTLTGRTEIWRVIKEQHTNPLVGEGFYIFWDTSKGQAVIDELLEIKSAHNGFLETYVDGGLIGEALLIWFLLASGKRNFDRLFAGDSLGKIGLAVWMALMIHNVSEASFFRLNAVWFGLMVVSLECTRRMYYQPASSRVQPAPVGAVTSA